MKKILIVTALIIASGSVYSWSNTNQAKPENSANSVSVASIKLAEAKAALSKANTKNTKNNLATADGGI